MAEGHSSSAASSWVAALIICLGFVIAGVGLITGPTWWLFLIGGGTAIAGGVLGLATGMMEDVH